MFIHPFTEQMKKLWNVSPRLLPVQKEESIAGVTCSTVAYKIHKYQVKNGVAPYIYHRPAHGQAGKGTAPYLALGDYQNARAGNVLSVRAGPVRFLDTDWRELLRWFRSSAGRAVTTDVAAAVE